MKHRALTGSSALDDSIGDALALVIDGNEVSRRTLVGMLRDFGVRKIEQAQRPQDARGMLEIRFFDIVLCDFHFAGETVNGQELMDDMRQAGLLPLGTVVVMISGERGYGNVAEAAEVALDAYLLKPHTAEALRVRLAKARERKRALSEVIALISQQQYEAAAAQAEVLAKAKGVAWLQAARIAADVYLRLGKPHDSARLLDEVLKSGALPWARLGLARAQTESGAVFKARRTLESLIADLPGYSDAYDVMGRVLLDQGEPAEAIVALRKAAELTPNSVARQVKLGLMSFYFGSPDEALDNLGRAVRLGISSKTFDLQGLILLATLQFDRHDDRSLTASMQSMARMRAAAPGSPRLRRFETTLGVLQALLRHTPAEAVSLLNGLLAEVREPTFEFEAATNLLMVLARLDENELHLADLDLHVDALATRFAVSRTTCDMMCAALRSRAELTTRVRTVYQHICDTAERAVGRTVAGEPAEALHLLLKSAEQTLNAKLMDLAQHTLNRHRDRIADAETLQQNIQKLLDTYRSYGAQVRIARVDDARSMNALSRPA